MNYLSLGYYVLVAGVFALYYLLPKQYRWTSLLAGSFVFYALANQSGLPVLVWMIVSSFFFAKAVRRSRWMLALSILVSVIPFWAHLIVQVISRSLPGWFLPMGLSYLSLQIISYLCDCAKGKIEPDTNPLKYALFMSFFPQVVQGPIPRYGDLAPQLYEGHELDEDNIAHGFVKILTGLFLKFLIFKR